MFRHLAYFLTCLSTVFVATTLHAQTLAPKPTALPDVGFAIIKTSQVAVVEALLVLGGRFTKQADSNFFAFLIKHHNDYLLFDTRMGKQIDGQYQQGGHAPSSARDPEP